MPHLRTQVSDLKGRKIFGEEQGRGMTQHLAAPPIGGGEGCSLRAAADWLREGPDVPRS